MTQPFCHKPMVFQPYSAASLREEGFSFPLERRESKRSPGKYEQNMKRPNQGEILLLSPALVSKAVLSVLCPLTPQASFCT